MENEDKVENEIPKEEIKDNPKKVIVYKQGEEPKERRAREVNPKDKETIEFDFGKVSDFFTKYQKPLLYFLLILLLVGGAYSRTTNIPNLEGKYLVSPDDPYVFLRYSEDVAADGSLTANDTLRYYPNGFDTQKENSLMAYLAGYSLDIANKINPDITIFDVAAWLSPILFVISLIAFFFLAKEFLKSEWASLAATGILAFSPSILLRTVSGFLEKEPLFLPLFLISMLFFVKAYKEKEKKKMYLFASVAGIVTGLAAFASGLFIFILFYLAAFIILEVIFDKMNKDKMFVYLIWLGLTIIVTNILTVKYGGFMFFKSTQFQIPLVAAVFAIVSQYIKKPKVMEKIPNGLFYTMVAIAIVLVGALVILGPSGLVEKISSLSNSAATPMGTTKMSQSVSENQPPTFIGGRNSWWDTFGISFGIANQSISIGVVFLMFFFGAIVLFYKEFKQFKYGKYLIGAFALFSLALVFEHFSNSQSLAWVNILFSQQIVFFSLFVIVCLVFLFLEHKSKEHIEKINSIHLLLIAWYIIAIVAANGAVRLFFIMAVPAALLAGYFIKWSYNWLSEHMNNDWSKYLPYLLAICIILPMFFIVSMSVSYMSPGLSVWYNTTDWISENTPEDAIFTHWWDYGYLVQTTANRATVGDPGNFYIERNYDIGGHIFNALNNSEILWFTDKYSLTDKDVYLMIPSEDILKFVQIAKLGSLGEGTEGRESFFTIYGVLSADTSIVPNNLPGYEEYPMLVILDAVTGQSPVLKEFRIGNNIYDEDSTYILRFLQPISENQSGPLLAQIIEAKSQRIEILPVECFCKVGVGCVDLNVTGVPTCVLDINGAVLNIPYKTKDTLFTQLFLLDKEIPGFKKVYDNGLGLNVNTAMGRGPMIRIYKYDFEALKSNEGW